MGNKLREIFTKSDGNNILITRESLEDVLDGIGYNYDEED